MFTTVLLVAAVTVPGTLTPREACEISSTVLRDMRYVEGKYADPGDFSHPKVKRRIDSCEEITKLAIAHGEDVVFASVAVAYNETNFDKTRHGKPILGKKGEQGRMQVMYKHHCKGVADLDGGKGICLNPERAGVRVLRGFLGSTPSAREIGRAKKWIRDLRKKRLAEGKPPTVLRSKHASLVFRLHRYNGSPHYGLKVAALYVTIQKARQRKVQQVALVSP